MSKPSSGSIGDRSSRVPTTAYFPLILNIGSTLLGGSGATVPLAQVIRASGYVVSTTLLIAGAVLTYCGSSLLVKACIRTGQTSYGDLAMHTLGRRGSIFVKTVIVLNSFGECLAVMLLFKETLWVGDDEPIKREHKVLFAAAVSLPIVVFVREFRRLAPLAFITALGALTLLVFIINRAFREGRYLDPGVVPFATGPMADTTVLEAVSSVAISMVVQFNVLPVYVNVRILATDDAERVTYVVLVWGIGLATIVYIATDVLSYVTFGAVDYDTIIDEYHSIWGGPLGVNALAIGQLVSYPLIAHAGVTEIANVLAGLERPRYFRAAAQEDPPGGKNEGTSLLPTTTAPPTAPPTDMFLAEGIAGMLWVVGTSCLAIAFSEAAHILNVVGACCALPLMAIFPPLMILQTKPPDAADGDPLTFAYRMALYCGCTITAICVVVSIANFK